MAQAAASTVGIKTNTATNSAKSADANPNLQLLLDIGAVIALSSLKAQPNLDSRPTSPAMTARCVPNTTPPPKRGQRRWS